jgi:hypothetical protein
MQRRDLSQVVTYGQGWTDPRYLGHYGHVSGLKYSFTWPGGCKTASWLFQTPALERVTAMNPSRLVKIFRGGGPVWTGQIDEPSADVPGWTMTAHGNSSFGAQFCDVWNTWDDIDDHLNQAISRGLLWRNPGLSGTSGLWFGDQTDAGSIQISDFLNAITVQGALGWDIDRRDGTISIPSLPSVVNRYLVSNTPVSRTLAEDINRLFVRYEDNSDNTSAAAPATHGLISEENTEDGDEHGWTESYIDITGNGVTTSGAAQQNAKNALARFNRVNFGNAFNIVPGQLLNAHGVPVDPGCERAGGVARLLMTDYGYGGESNPILKPFIIGEYEYDDSTLSGKVTAFQSAFDDFTSLLAAIFPVVSTAVQ